MLSQSILLNIVPCSICIKNSFLQKSDFQEEQQTLLSSSVSLCRPPPSPASLSSLLGTTIKMLGLLFSISGSLLSLIKGKNIASSKSANAHQGKLQICSKIKSRQIATTEPSLMLAQGDLLLTTFPNLLSPSEFGTKTKSVNRVLFDTVTKPPGCLAPVRSPFAAIPPF